LQFFSTEGKTMRTTIVQLLLLLATVSAGASALSQSQSSVAQDASGQGNSASAQLQTSSVRILHPRSGQSLDNDFVTVRFELVRKNPGGGNNNFMIQLDAQDPINTSQSQCTFTSLRPGQHMIAVTEVDANGNSLRDARTEVQFSVQPPAGTLSPAQSNSKPTSGK